MHSKQESEQSEQFSIFWDTCREEIDLLKFVIFHSIFRDGYKFDGTIPVHYWRLGTPRTHRKESSNNLYICHLYQTKYLLLTHNSKCMYHLAIKQGQRTFFVGFYKSMHVKRSKWIKLSYNLAHLLDCWLMNESRLFELVLAWCPPRPGQTLRLAYLLVWSWCAFIFVKLQ